MPFRVALLLTTSSKLAKPDQDETTSSFNSFISKTYSGDSEYEKDPKTRIRF